MKPFEHRKVATGLGSAGGSENADTSQPTNGKLNINNKAMTGLFFIGFLIQVSSPIRLAAGTKHAISPRLS